MDLNFDYRRFQRESMERLAKIYAESFKDQEDNQNLTEADTTFNKIQMILDCPEMEKCHLYLFTLDREHVMGDDKRKVDELYECGVKRGFIKEDDRSANDGEIQECDDCDSSLCGGPEDSLADLPMRDVPQQEVQAKPTYTVLYSAMKNGDIKVGEFYSLATSNESAKNDCVTQLQSAGYTNVSVMAIEQNIDAVDQNVEQTPPDENMYDIYEDDSEEYEKQETGDTSGDGDTNGGSGDASSNDNSTEGSSDDGSTDDGSKETDSTEDPEDSTEDGSEGTNPEESPEDGTGGDTEDSEEASDDESDDSKENSDTDATSDPEEEPEEKKLTAEEKSQLKDAYTKVFKSVLPKVSTEKSVSEMTIAEKNDFYSKLAEKWTKNDPSEFLSDKDQEKLNKFIAKPEEKASK